MSLRRAFRFAVLAVVLFAPLRVFAQSIIADIPIDLGELSRVAANPATGKVYVAGYSWAGERVIHVVDSATNMVTTTIVTNVDPRVIAVNPATNRVYVAGPSFMENVPSLAVIDGATDTLSAVVETGTNAEGLAVNSVTNRIYVAGFRFMSNETVMAVIDGASNQVLEHAPLPVDGLGGTGSAPVNVLAVQPATNRIFILGSWAGQNVIGRLDGATHQFLEPIAIDVWTDGFDISVPDNRIYVAGHEVTGAPVLVSYDADSGIEQSRLSITNDAVAMAINAATSRVYLHGSTVNDNTNRLTVIDTTANAVRINLRMETEPLSMSIDTAANRAYVLGYQSYYNVRRLTVIDLTEQPDVTPPVLTLTDSVAAEATSGAGAAVEFAASAQDDFDGDAPVTCTPAAGDTFALGFTDVQCQATDAAGNTATGNFHVTVVDTTAPALTLPPDLTAEAAGPDGAVVAYTASASDLVDAAVVVDCYPPSGSGFGVGVTVVNCGATDASGNTAQGSFTVTIVDTTAPIVTVPAPIVAEATSNGGASVAFTASAFDTVSGNVPVVCSHLSGATFPIGVTTLTCEASDESGNLAGATFTITVQDTTAPSIASLTASPDHLWPANGRMTDVTLTAEAIDAVTGSPSCSIDSVSSNQPVTGLPDWNVTGPLTLSLRAEKEGGTRIYTIAVICLDAALNAATRSVTVAVAKP